MRFILCVFLAIVSLSASAATYEGGNVPLNQGKAKFTISENNVVFFHGNRKVSVPIKNITNISCSTESRRRMAHLGKAEEYFIGLTWDVQGARNEAVFKLGNGEYHELLAALERLTGRPAVNTKKTPTVVQYGL
jgi:hypothetical protein